MVETMILETKRLYLREMQQSDFLDLCEILQDKEVMYAYEGAFNDIEVQEWLDKQIQNYQKYKFGLWSVVLKEENIMIGQCGLTLQDFNGKQVIEIGYLFKKKFWHNGFATEAAIACKGYAFDKLKANEVFSIIRDNNLASQNVAKRNGMSLCGKFTKHYRNVDMPHLVFSINKN